MGSIGYGVELSSDIFETTTDQIIIKVILIRPTIHALLPPQSHFLMDWNGKKQTSLAIIILQYLICQNLP